MKNFLEQLFTCSYQNRLSFEQSVHKYFHFGSYYDRHNCTNVLWKLQKFHQTSSFRQYMFVSWPFLGKARLQIDMVSLSN